MWIPALPILIVIVDREEEWFEAVLITGFRLCFLSLAGPAATYSPKSP
jgi:hypothetical protein